MESCVSLRSGYHPWQTPLAAEPRQSERGWCYSAWLLMLSDEARITTTLSTYLRLVWAASILHSPLSSLALSISWKYLVTPSPVHSLTRPGDEKEKKPTQLKCKLTSRKTHPKESLESILHYPTPHRSVDGQITAESKYM